MTREEVADIGKEHELFDEEESTDEGFEFYVHNNDGTGDYESIGIEVFGRVNVKGFAGGILTVGTM